MQSDTIGKLADALAKAQGMMENPARSADNPFFKSRYAPLSAITDAIRKPLSANGLSYTQTIDPGTDGGLFLVTRLMHVSGEWIDSAMPLPNAAKPQEFGSVLTYFRRYELSAIVGVTADDDDDGNAGNNQTVQSQQRKPAQTNGKPAQSPKQAEAENSHDSTPISDKTKRTLHALGNELYGPEWEVKRHSLVKHVTAGATESSNELTEAQAQTLIDGMRKRQRQLREQAGDNPFSNAPDPGAPMGIDMDNVPELAH